MRNMCWPAVLLIVAVCPALAWAQGKDRPLSPAEQQEKAKTEAVDRVAEQAFQQADRNHNGSLSRVEMHAADELLQAGIAALAEQGVLGQPIKPGQQPGANNGKQGKNQAQPANGLPGNGAPASAANKNRVTLIELKAYAQQLGREADLNYSVARTQAQQMQQRMGRGRGMPYYPAMQGGS